MISKKSILVFISFTVLFMLIAISVYEIKESRGVVMEESKPIITQKRIKPKTVDDSFEISREEAIKVFLDNYDKFQEIATLLEKEKGYFYADRVTGNKELRIDSNKAESSATYSLSNEELKRKVLYIIDNLEFIGIYQDKDGSSISFCIEANDEGTQWIRYIFLDEPKNKDSDFHKHIKGKWYHTRGLYE